MHVFWLFLGSAGLNCIMPKQYLGHLLLVNASSAAICWMGSVSSQFHLLFYDVTFAQHSFLSHAHTASKAQRFV